MINKITKYYTVEYFVFPCPFAKGEYVDVGVCVPMINTHDEEDEWGSYRVLTGQAFYNTDPPRAAPVCFDTKEDCVKWMNDVYPEWTLTE